MARALSVVFVLLACAVARHAFGDVSAVVAGHPPDTIDRAVAIVRDVGFPIVVAIYLLVRMDPILRDLTKAIHDLAQKLEAGGGS